MIETTGQRLKEIRTSKKMSMADLCKITGVSKSLISQVERGEVYPSLTTLDKIATALDVPLNKIFQVNSDNLGEQDIVVRKDKRKKILIPGSNNIYNVLTPSLHNDTEFLIIEYPPYSGTTDKPDYFRHDGEEYFYVLEGELEFTVNNNTYTIYEGDSGSFNSSNVHYFVNNTNRDAKIIICAIKPGL